jgi:hypothetical protein
MIVNYISIPDFDFVGDTITIKGRCILEDPSPVWKPFKLQLIDHINIRKNSIINFRLDGFNTSSIMYISLLIRIIDSMWSSKNIIINWYYLYMDEDMLEYGENFKEMLKHVTMNLIPIEGQKLN